MNYLLDSPPRYERHRISCEVEGRRVSGNYWIAGSLLVVSTARGGTSSLLAGRVPHTLAESLLKGLAAAGKV